MDRQLRIGMSKIEALLVRNNIISGQFLELNGQMFKNTHNYRRLFLLAITTAICFRYGAVLMFYNVEVCNILGDVFWTLGVMGYFTTWLVFLVGTIVVWYLIAIMYCEYHGQLGFLNDLNVAIKTKSDYSVSLNAKMQLLYQFLVVNAFVMPYVNGTCVLALCTWNAYQTDNSIPQMLYNFVWNICSVAWAKIIVIVVFRVSGLVYLTTSVINQNLNVLFRYFKLCKDPFTLSRVLNEYTDAILKINQANRFVKLALGSVNFIAVPFISICLNIITVPSDSAVMRCLIFTAGGCVFILFVSTAAFIASVHFNVR